MAEGKNVFVITKRERRIRLVYSIFLSLYCSIVVFLIFITFLGSFKTKSDLVRNTLGFPREFTLDSYKTLIFEDNFLRIFLNSTILTVLSIAGIVFISSLTAYGLSRFKFKYADTLQTYFLLGLMFPIQLGILPIFIMMRKLNMINNLFGMVLLYSANMSFPVFIFSVFFRTLPYALYEAAKVDGAGEFTIYFRIMLPLSKPVIATIALLSTITVWNDFYLPLVFLTKDNLRTVTLGVYRYMSNFLANWHLIFSAASLSLIPIIILFGFFSRNIISGITSGSLKQ
ncbi:MAG: raffinose/stachyose/melibiose transport system permease protein [Halanaerobiales bacterium]|nr:raffinose/stachyose/melibiose transport system permease protein [Halanaerobiales bacterium]